MEYVLICDCTSTDFDYIREDAFKCKDCGSVIPESVAGNHLLGVEKIED